MKNRSRKRWIVKFIAWALLIQVINISIDSMDAVSDNHGITTAKEDLSINDIESIYELVSEHYMGIDVPEYDEHDRNGFVKVMVFYFAASAVDNRKEYPTLPVSFFAIEQNLNSIALDHTSPPPKTA